VSALIEGTPEPDRRDPPDFANARLYMNIAIKLQMAMEMGSNEFCIEMIQNGGTSASVRTYHENMIRISTNHGLVQYT